MLRFDPKTAPAPRAGSRRNQPSSRAKPRDPVVRARGQLLRDSPAGWRARRRRHLVRSIRNCSLWITGTKKRPAYISRANTSCAAARATPMSMFASTATSPSPRWNYCRIKRAALERESQSRKSVSRPLLCQQWGPALRPLPTRLAAKCAANQKTKT